MFANADSIVEFLVTRGKGAKAQIGYDLTVKNIKRIPGGSSVLTDKTQIIPYEEVSPIKIDGDRYCYMLHPGTYSLTFDQGCCLDNKHGAFIRHRSSILRSGGIITSGVYDPGFQVDEMGAVLIVTVPFTIELGARVAQIVLFETETSQEYDGQFQGGKDVK